MTMLYLEEKSCFGNSRLQQLNYVAKDQEPAVDNRQEYLQVLHSAKYVIQIQGKLLILIVNGGHP